MRVIPHRPTAWVPHRTDRTTTVTVITAAAVALVEYIGRRTDTTPAEHCIGHDGCYGYRGGIPMLVAAGGMLLLGIAFRLLEIEGRDRIVRILFPIGLLCVIGLRYARFLVDRGIGPPETLFPPTFEWMAVDDIVLAAVAAFAAVATAPGPRLPRRRALMRVAVELAVAAGLWAAVIVVHGDTLSGSG